MEGRVFPGQVAPDRSQMCCGGSKEPKEEAGRGLRCKEKETNNSPIRVANFSIFLAVINKVIGQKIKKGTEDFNRVLNYLGLSDIPRTLCSLTADCKFFSWNICRNRPYSVLLNKS